MLKYSLIALLLYSSLAFSQAPKLRLERFTIDKGLSQNAVSCIVQDYQGFLWIGTEDGLNRYDGYNFEVFKKELNNENTISDNFVSAMYEDKKNTLWIGTSGAGLNRYDALTKSFTKYHHNESDPNSLSSEIVRCIFEDSQNRLWIGTNNGLDLLDRKTGKFSKIKNQPSKVNSLPNNTINTIFEDKSNNLWIGTDNGLALIATGDVLTENFKIFYHSNLLSNSLAHNSIFQIIQDKLGDIWISTRDGVSKHINGTDRFTNYLYNANSKNAIADRIVPSIRQDKDGLIWFATYNGVSILDPIKNEFYQYTCNPIDPNTLSDNLTQFLYEDNSGVMWVGTKFGGLTKFRKTKDFDNYLNGETVGPIVQSRFDMPNIVWAGTARNGLIKLDRNSNKIIAQYNTNTKDSRYRLPDNSTNALYEDKKGDLWVGTWNSGLVQIKFKTLPSYQIGKIEREIEKINVFYNEPGNPYSIHDNTVQVIYEDDQNRMWVGHSRGLDYFDRAAKKFYTFTHNPNDENSLTDNSIQGCFLQDKNGDYWVGTWNGLNRIILKDKTAAPSASNSQFIRYYNNPKDTTSLSDNKVITIWEDNNGNIWVGTYGGGISKIVNNPKATNLKDQYFFKVFTDKNGLPNNSVYGIKDDGKDNIWISTNNGLSRFNTKTEKFRNFEATDGLQSNQFFWRSSFQKHDGELFFGGINGLNAFYPDNIQDSEILPQIAITSFKIFGKEVEIGEDSQLEEQLTNNSQIELSAKDKVFSFDFTGLHFYEPFKNKYEYKMEGFDENWVSASANRRFASYTNLDPKTYTFKVRASNSDGYWNNDGMSIKITINPPWWATWWFRIFALLVIGGSIYYYIKDRTKTMLESQRVLEEKIHAATEEATIRNAKLEEAKVKLASIMEDVKSQLGKTSVELLEASNSQASSIEEISASMEQMTKEINDNAVGAAKIFSSAKSIEKDAKQSVIISNNTVNSIQDISNEIAFISEFARLTKFLSLNASIEAAQAGENGKTFSVVAEQIRKLANQSKEVAVNITKVSVSGLKLSAETSQKITDLQALIETIVVLIKGISESSQNQSAEANHINTAIQHLAANVNSTSQLAEKLDAAIQSLSIDD